MDYKEKYEKALEWARSAIQAGADGMLKEDLEEIFPELKESEDEGIRRALLNFLEDELEKHGNEEWDGCFYTTDVIAWIEKQGEQKPVDNVEPKFEVGDVMRTLQEAADNVTSGLPVVISIDKEYYHCTNELIAIKDQDGYEYPPMNRIQKPAWSEEDEKVLNDIIGYLCTHDSCELKGFNKWYDFLKSLKDRVQPQLRQEWSEEDELTGFEEAVFDLLGDNGYYYDGFHLTAEELSKQIVSLARKQIAKEIDIEPMADDYYQAYIENDVNEGVAKEHRDSFVMGAEAILDLLKKG